MKSIRNTRGSMSVLVAGLSLSVLSIGFFSAEVCNLNLAGSHLRNVCDAASMAAALRLVSSPETDSESQENAAVDSDRAAAKQLAVDLLKTSSVMGISMEKAVEANIDTLASLPPGATAYSVKFVDENGKESREGKHIQVKAAYGVPPFSGKLLGLGTYLVKGEGRSSAAKLDLAFCLDNSLSMATDTEVSFYRREKIQDPLFPLDPTKKIISYTAVGKAGKAKEVGANIGVVEPLYLQSCKSPFHFDAALRSNPENHSMPNDGNAYTDRVVPADPEFHNAIVALEAERGNLDSPEAFKESGTDIAFLRQGISFTPRANCKKDYEKAAASQIKPFYNAKVEIKNFFNLMEHNTDSHFSLIPFSHGAAHVEGGTSDEWRISPFYEPKRQAFPFGKVELDKRQSRFAKVKSEIDTYRLYGGTDIPAAVREAISTLTNDSVTRSDARKAILLFTDGEPSSNKYKDPVAESIAAAEEAGSHGIAIFAVGFLHEGKNARAQSTLEAMVKKGGPGGKAFIVQDIKKLHDVFRAMARELVTLE